MWAVCLAGSLPFPRISHMHSGALSNKESKNAERSKTFRLVGLHRSTNPAHRSTTKNLNQSRGNAAHQQSVFRALHVWRVPLFKPRSVMKSHFEVTTAKPSYPSRTQTHFSRTEEESRDVPATKDSYLHTSQSSTQAHMFQINGYTNVSTSRVLLTYAPIARPYIRLETKTATQLGRSHFPAQGGRRLSIFCCKKELELRFTVVKLTFSVKASKAKPTVQHATVILWENMAFLHIYLQYSKPLGVSLSHTLEDFQQPTNIHNANYMQPQLTRP